MKKEIKPIPSSELMDAMDLVWTVFSDTAAKDCTDEGKEEFWQSTDFEHMLQRTGDGRDAQTLARPAGGGRQPRRAPAGAGLCDGGAPRD